jgi:L-ascorbate metabolism protein UlaG (beta-lactamase superfamily)
MSYDHIQVNTQSSIRIEGSKVVYFDPFQISSEAHDADLICITHAHYDHFDPESILKVCNPDTELAAPVSMAKELGKLAWKGKQHLLAPGDCVETAGLVITAKPAYNKLKPFHPKRNGWLGYLLEMDGRVYYAAGDTDAVKELQVIRCDVALVPIGGKFTMNAKEAAGLINKIQPKVAIPTHYGSIVGKPQDAETFRKMIDREVQVVVKL